ncbi:O-antigen ligase [Cryobacterium sp. Hb1]|uniref:O-antigen ligase family protein n=1 Tax=Cryobacterium sp. Hb1 TaxID=1259147 RepID=UPI00106A7D41|nr:O-antigen ligase domain-containing protein [Cryobacterium sp. Hb1]TFD71741.1 O-antigen ligase domain-containing protein [Cryobacterium sp. Hb1]
MFDSTLRRLRSTPVVLIAFAALLVIVASVVLPRFITTVGIILIPLTLLAFAAAATLLLLPVHILPAVALVTFALVPARVLPQDGPIGALPLTTMIIVIWAVRRLLPTKTDGQPATPPTPFRSATRYFALIFLVWTLFTLARTTDLQASLGWMISFSAAVLLPLCIGTSTREAYWIRRTWLLLGAWLGAYAVVESVLRFNPIWGTLFTALGLTDHQHWSVYRADASFGHPLFAALFLAVACALAIGIWLQESSKPALVAAIFSGLGLVATVSRGAILAAAIAVGFAYTVSLLLRGEKHWGKFALLAMLMVVAVVGLFQFDAFTARNNSIEAELSSQARDLGVWVSVQAANLTGWIGSGPGTSGITGRLFNDVTIENSLLQLLISLGLPGVVLFLLMIGSAVAHALSRRAVGAAAALLAYTVCIAGFNAIDALRPMHLLLGCLLILALNPTRADAAGPHEPGRAPSARRLSGSPNGGTRGSNAGKARTLR